MRAAHVAEDVFDTFVDEFAVARPLLARERNARPSIDFAQYQCALLPTVCLCVAERLLWAVSGVDDEVARFVGRRMADRDNIVCEVAPSRHLQIIGAATSETGGRAGAARSEVHTAGVFHCAWVSAPSGCVGPPPPPPLFPSSC